MNNKIQLTGYLTHAPEAKVLESGEAIVTFLLTTPEVPSTSKDFGIQPCQQHSIIAEGKKADMVMKCLKKGSEVALKGLLTYHIDKTHHNEYHKTAKINLQGLSLLRHR